VMQRAHHAQAEHQPGQQEGAYELALASHRLRNRMPQDCAFLCHSFVYAVETYRVHKRKRPQRDRLTAAAPRT
jgi:hypothetical protein